jgi:hypothetical protein
MSLADHQFRDGSGWELQMPTDNVGELRPVRHTGGGAEYRVSSIDVRDAGTGTGQGRHAVLRFNWTNPPPDGSVLYYQRGGSFDCMMESADKARDLWADFPGEHVAAWSDGTEWAHSVVPLAPQPPISLMTLSRGASTVPATIDNGWRAGGSTGGSTGGGGSPTGPAVLSNPGALVSTTPGTVTLAVDHDNRVGEDRVYYVITDSASPPGQVRMFRGDPHMDGTAYASGDVPSGGSGTTNINVMGLPAVEMWAHFIQGPEGALQSERVSTAAFTPNAASGGGGGGEPEANLTAAGHQITEAQGLEANVTPAGHQITETGA